MTELWELGAAELAAAIRNREVTSREVVEAHLARIDAVNPALNALAEAVAATDAPVVERLRAAGAIPIGRTNLPDLGLRLHTDSALHGLTRNPWNAAATEIPPIDVIMASQLMFAEGVMARRIEDVLAGFEAVAGQHPRDPLSLPVALPPAATRPLRIAVVADPPGGSTDTGIAGAIRAAADFLAEAGHDVTEALPPSYEQAIAQWGALLAPDLEAQRPLIEAVIGDDGLRFLELTGERLAGFGTDGLPALFLDRYRIANEWQQFYGRFDVLLTPTWTAPPFEHGFDILSVDTAVTVLETIRPVLPANYLGLPAVVVPAAVVDGLPVGAQFTAARFADLTALAAAAALEAAVGTFTPIDPR